MRLKWIAFSALALLAACQQPTPQPPAPPTGFSATATSSTQINLTWTASQGATGYVLERKNGTPASTNTYTIIDSNLPATPTSFNNTGLTANTDYTYRLKAKNDNGESTTVEATAKTQPGTTPPPPPPPSGLIKTTTDKRFFLTSDDKPFFYLADTAWFLFQQLSTTEATTYLTDRTNKGFTVIQAVVVWETFSGAPYGETTIEGQKPFTGDNPTTPNETYFQKVDAIVNKANDLGLYVQLAPTWRDRLPGTGGSITKYFNATNAKTYGTFLGNRYKNKKVLWWLGTGDSPDATRKDIWKAMAQGIRDAVGTGQFITYLPDPGNATSDLFTTDPLFDIDLTWSGTGTTFYTSVVGSKNIFGKGRPVVEGLAVYEDYPSYNGSGQVVSRTSDYEPRRIAYWNYLAGAAGHTYTHHSVWQFFKGTSPASLRPSSTSVHPLLIDATLTWDKALNSPGAQQMGFLKKMLSARPFTSGVANIGVFDNSTVSGVDNFKLPRALSDASATGRFAVAYFTKEFMDQEVKTGGRKIKVNLSVLTGPVRAWWFNPVTGVATKIAENLPNTGAGSTPELTPINTTQDWVLVLDKMSENYPEPGK